MKITHPSLSPSPTPTATSSVRHAALVGAAALAMLLWAGCSSPKPPPAPPRSVEAMRRSVSQASQLNAEGNWIASSRAWEQAAKEAYLLNDRAQAAIALHNQALAERELGNLDRAQALLGEASLLNDRLGRINEWWRNQIAAIQVDTLRNNKEALETRFGRLQSRAAEIQDPQVRGLYLNELGLWLLNRGELGLSENAFRQADEQFKKAADSTGMAAVLANQALLLERQNNLSAALETWRLALRQFEALGDTRGIAAALLGQGRVLLLEGRDLPQAEDLLRRAARNYEILQLRPSQISALELLAQCLTAQGKSPEAEKIRQQFSEPKP